ncbi:MAG: hypothetical protein NTV24_04250 [Candidatus Woesebacteria bacterium]|nr:hypothetical protein [Candidatus Woesebacteria bacterium]
MEPQAASQPQTPPIPHAPQVKNSLVLIMSILLIVTVAIAGLFYFQIQKLSKELSKYQTQNTKVTTNTTKEETCTNCVDNKYKISFEVPTGYLGYIKDKGYADDYTILKTYDQPQRVNSSIGVSFFPELYYPVSTCEDANVNFRNVDLNELYHVHLKNMRVGETKTIDGDGSVMDKFSQYDRMNDAKIAGKNATVFINKNIWEGGPDVVEKLYFIENGDSNSFSSYIVAINSLVYPASNHDEINTDILEKILSSFKFTEAAPLATPTPL